MKKLLLALSSMALITACNTTAPKPESANLVLLYTTDVHGAALQYDFKHDAPAETSLANVCTYVKQQREANPDAVMLFDTGDFLQGQPSMYYYNFVDTLSQHIAARVYNYMCYDALGAGNHDIETGEAVYNGSFANDLQMPWLCANAIDTRTSKPMFQPYTVITRQGFKIAILGMITPHIHAWLPKTLWPNLEFEDMIECARKWVPEIQKKEQPDLLIGLFHSGSNYTIDGADIDTPFNENGGIPAATKVPGFDIILLGHDHSQGTFDIINVAGDTVKVLDAATQARLIGRADIALSRNADGTYSKNITSSLIKAIDYPADAAFCAEFEADVKKVNEYVDAPIGKLTDNLPGINGLYGPCPFMDLVHDVQLWATKADVSFAAVLSPYEVIPAGTITMRHLFSIYKYENQLFTLRMKGSEIKKYLEHGFAQQFNTLTGPSSQLLKRVNGKLATATFNYTSAAGIRYTVDLTKPEGERVIIHSMSDGSAFDFNADYKVALNSYQASGGGNFIPVGLGWSQEQLEDNTLDTTPIDVRRYVAAYIKEQGTITPHLRGDWNIVPTDWWENAKKHEIADSSTRNAR